MDDLSTLRERLAEISDLSRAAGVLGWEQRVSMPPLGTESRAESLATLGRIIHDRFTDPEIGRLLERLAPLEESLPYDSDDASLIRVTRRDWEKACRVPDRAARRDDPRGGQRAPRLGRGAAERRLRLVPPLPADERRAQAPLHRVLRAGRPALHRAPRRLRAGHDDDRGARRVRDAAPRADRARAQRPRGRRVVPPRVVRPRRPAALRGAGRRHARLRGGRLAPRPDRAPVLHLVLEPRRAADDALPAGRPRVGLVDAARGGPRALRPRHRRLADALDPQRRAVARDQRVAEPDLGEPRRPQPPVLDVLVRTIAGDVPRSARRASTSMRSCARSTAPSPG